VTCATCQRIRKRLIEQAQRARARAARLWVLRNQRRVDEFNAKARATIARMRNRNGNT